MTKTLAQRMRDIEQAALLAAAEKLYAAICSDEAKKGMGLLSRPKLERASWCKLADEIITEYNVAKVRLIREAS